jgi:alanine racemase
LNDSHPTVLEIDLNALSHNLSVLRSRLNPETQFLAVVKAFAYGSDMLQIAQTLENEKVDYLAVAYTQEGVLLRKGGIRLPILVLHPQPAQLKQCIDHCLEPSIYSPRLLKSFIQVAEESDQKDFPLHLKFNTGLNRLGFWENDVDWIQGQLQETTAVKVKGLLSHLAASDDLNENPFTQAQIKNFTAISAAMEKALGNLPLRHLANTSGILNHPEAQFDMVRSGIALYGYGNAPQFDQELKPLARLRTVISQLHKIEPGESVGYNRAYKAPGYRLIATLPLGHADGIGRQYGQGKGQVWVKGSLAPIVGNVCMDMLMVDVSGIDCKEGDEVVIFGPEHSAEHFAQGAGTISYELITGISSRVPRKIIPLQ